MTFDSLDLQDRARQLSRLAARDKLSRARCRLVFIGFVVSVLLACALATVGYAEPADSGSFAPKTGKHETHRREPGVIAPHNSLPVAVEPDSVPRTRSSFFAAWNDVPGATSYKLDIATDPQFQTFVGGYRGLDVGHVTGRVVTGLDSGRTYYYRVRASFGSYESDSSDPATAATLPGSGLTITPTFDSSITGDPNAAAIEAMINRAISFSESIFSDPLTVPILFRYSTTAPNGDPLGAGTLAQSNYVIYTVSWNAFINALVADETTGNDAQAINSLPGSSLSSSIIPSSAGGRCIGLNTPAAICANGSICGTPPFYDGIVTINSAQSFQFTRPTTAGNFDAQRSTEHEIDEVLGLGSNVNASSNYRPQDLFSWSGLNVRNFTASGTRYFSIDTGQTNIVGFNQESGGDYGDWFSPACPQANPYVQDAFSCPGQYDDISPTSPEGINLDVIGYDLAGDVNTFYGTGAGASTTGINDSGFGYNALFSNTTGKNNTAIGWNALEHNTIGVSDTAVGANALLSNIGGGNNVAIGLNALQNNTSGGNNIAIGTSAGLNLNTGSNNIDIGALGASGESNTIRFGKISEQTNAYMIGIRGATVAGGVTVMVDSSGHLGTVTSSARYKEDIEPMDKASEAILALQPVTFRYKKELDPEAIPQFGLVAEQVEKVDPDLVAYDNEGNPQTVRYEAVNAMLLNEFRKAHRDLEDQDKAIDKLKADIQDHNAQLQKLVQRLRNHGQ